MRELGRICASRKMLPESWIISPSDLILDEFPFTSAGFSDIFLGILNGLKVCVKRIRLYRGGTGYTEVRFSTTTHLANPHE